MKLSICIPTYNRKDQIIGLLDNIDASAGVIDCYDDLEVSVSDNGSTDGTYEELLAYKGKSRLNLVISHFAKNQGFDNNLKNAVSNSSGDFCWLFGDDDRLCQGSLKRILDEISSCHTFYIFNRINFDKSGIRNSTTWLRPSINKDRVFYLDSDVATGQYFNYCDSIAGVFSFISSTVINRAEWNSVEVDEKYIGTAYIHVYICCSILIRKKASLKYIYEPLVTANTGVPFENASSYIKRALIDINGYKKIAELFTYDEQLKEDFLKIVGRELGIVPIICLSKHKKAEREGFLDCLTEVGFSREWVNILKEICNSRIALFIYRLKRKSKRIMQRN